jgi:hypothetical protein
VSLCPLTNQAEVAQPAQGKLRTVKEVAGHGGLDRCGGTGTIVFVGQEFVAGYYPLTCPGGDTPRHESPMPATLRTNVTVGEVRGRTVATWGVATDGNFSPYVAVCGTSAVGQQRGLPV